MTVKYLKPREWNQSGKVSLFIKLWDQPLNEVQMNRLKEQAPVSQKRSSFGNLNNEGTPYPSTSCLVSRFHPDFESILEAGVVRVVEAVGIHHNLVTYTSCEGHNYQNANTPKDERHVGIVARNREEHTAVVQLFEQAAAFVNQHFAGTPIEGAIMNHSVSDCDQTYLAVDLYLCKREGHAWDTYFDAVDQATEVMCDFLFDQEPVA